MKVVLSQESIDCLVKILSYYQRKGHRKYGRKIRARILNRIRRLKDFPMMGQMEEHLKETGLGYRYLIEENYKIIYLIYNDYVLITGIFDTRQDPEKM
ncbi:MAG: type II toxin-antitoxin system RelE/ParE family toxin [Saprospiraceae bacterium]|nr:MAG: type II toxin-antitoxin system RelE/ParE family toxin [Saprospiraceae bacterium]